MSSSGHKKPTAGRKKPLVSPNPVPDSDASSGIMTPSRVKKLKLGVLALYCYILWVCFRRQFTLTAHLDPFVALPVLVVAVMFLIDNIRLVMGVVKPEKQPSRNLAYVNYLLRYICMPSILSAYAAMTGNILGAPFLGYVGAAVSVFFCMNGLNLYVSRIHGHLTLRTNDGFPRFTKPNLDTGPDIFILPIRYIRAGALMLTTVVLVVTSDWAPIFLILVTIFVATIVIPALPNQRLLISHALEVIFVLCLIRCERHGGASVPVVV